MLDGECHFDTGFPLKVRLFRKRCREIGMEQLAER